MSLIPIWAAILGVGSAMAPAIDFGEPVFVTHIMSQDIGEASGLAASLRSDDYYWIINDSQNGPELFAVDRRGNTLGAVTLRGVENIDWEALDSVVVDGSPYLVVADVGDNEAARSQILLHFVEEPDPAVASVTPAWTVILRLPQGATDIEAIFADADAGYIYLLSKRQIPPELWRFPLTARGETEAEWRCRVDNIPRPTAADLVEDPRLGAFRSQVTAMDALPDGSGVVLLTYRNAYFYPRDEGQSWSEAFAHPPQTIVMPRMAKPEALTFSRDGRKLMVTSEHWPAPLLELPVSHD